VEEINGIDLGDLCARPYTTPAQNALVGVPLEEWVAVVNLANPVGGRQSPFRNAQIRR
jgi:hypothetical protein